MSQERAVGAAEEKKWGTGRPAFRDQCIYGIWLPAGGPDGHGCWLRRVPEGEIYAVDDLQIARDRASELLRDDCELFFGASPRLLWSKTGSRE